MTRPGPDASGEELYAFLLTLRNEDGAIEADAVYGCDQAPRVLEETSSTHPLGPVAGVPALRLKFSVAGIALFYDWQSGAQAREAVIRMHAAAMHGGTLVLDCPFGPLRYQLPAELVAPAVFGMSPAAMLAKYTLELSAEPAALHPRRRRPGR